MQQCEKLLTYQIGCDLLWYVHGLWLASLHSLAGGAILPAALERFCTGMEQTTSTLIDCNQ